MILTDKQIVENNCNYFTCNECSHGQEETCPLDRIILNKVAEMTNHKGLKQKV